MTNFDLVVIGSGSGLEISAEAAERRLSVAVVEEGPFGGTCLNRGCIPSKILIHCADVMETIRGAERFGIKAHVAGLDWQFIIRRATEEIDADAQNIEEGNRQADNITVYKGRGRFVGPKTLEVNGEQFSGDTIVIAAGTHPSIPEIPGLKDVPYITSDEALRLPEQPRRLVIVGGGYTAAEIAHFFGALGTKVTIIHRSPMLLRAEDQDISQRFTQVYQGKFNTMMNAQLSRAYLNEDEIAMAVSIDGRTEDLTTDALLIATGRMPNTDTLDVASTGVEINRRGFVKTNEYLETNVPGIWALGDIVGKYLLKNGTNLEAAHVGNNVFGPDNQVAVDYHTMPQAIFASPQVGSVGLTEQEAKAGNAPYVAATYAYYDTASCSSIEDRDGFVKVLADHHTEEILGCHIVGTDASMLIQEVANAMRLRLSTDAITQSIYVPAALPEVGQRAFGSLAYLR